MSTDEPARAAENRPGRHHGRAGSSPSLWQFCVLFRMGQVPRCRCRTHAIPPARFLPRDTFLSTHSYFQAFLSDLMLNFQRCLKIIHRSGRIPARLALHSPHASILVLPIRQGFQTCDPSGSDPPHNPLPGTPVALITLHPWITVQPAGRPLLLRLWPSLRTHAECWTSSHTCWSAP